MKDLAMEVEDAQRVVAGWSKEKRSRVRLEGGAGSLLSSAPIGTFAPSCVGGGWTKTRHGWEASGGDAVPRPGADWTGELRYPNSTNPNGVSVPASHTFPQSNIDAVAGKGESNG